MTHRRPAAPGSFQDSLNRVIERVAPNGHKLPAKPERPKERRISGPTELNDRLIGSAWRKGR